VAPGEIVWSAIGTSRKDEAGDPGATNKTLTGEAENCSVAETVGLVTEVAVIVTAVGVENFAGAAKVTEVGVGLVKLPKFNGVTLQVTPALLGS
jgi:hypothetical protein